MKNLFALNKGADVAYCDLKRSRDCVAGATRNWMLARSAKSQQATAAIPEIR